ncbi:MAG TPA: sulfotransferase [Polyangia bacterium]|nr:sulfotransferase [Polyangia bacterium]
MKRVAAIPASGHGQTALGPGGYPDFIIIGAMKSGTTSVHSILAHHEEVFIPDNEVYFFDVDDVEQHPDFFVRTRDGWTFHDFDADFPRYLEWYENFFKGASPGQVIGEDTTTYLASSVAPARIARLLPDVKLIAMLRDPVSRAYSHYWHNVTAGRMVDTFENTLRFSPGNLFKRGCYYEQLSRYASFLEAGRIKVVFFEEFLADNQRVTDELCAFIGLSSSVDVTKVEVHRNASSAPVSLHARLLGNRIYTSLVRSRKSFKNIPNMPHFEMKPASAQAPPRSKVAAACHAVVEARPGRKYPPMKPGTKEFLQQVFRKKNDGLSALLGRDVSAYWAYMK